MRFRSPEWWLSPGNGWVSEFPGMSVPLRNFAPTGLEEISSSVIYRYSLDLANRREEAREAHIMRKSVFGSRNGESRTLTTSSSTCLLIAREQLQSESRWVESPY